MSEELEDVRAELEQRMLQVGEVREAWYAQWKRTTTLYGFEEHAWPAASMDAVYRLKWEEQKLTEDLDELTKIVRRMEKEESDA